MQKLFIRSLYKSFYKSVFLNLFIVLNFKIPAHVQEPIVFCVDLDLEK